MESGEGINLEPKKQIFIKKSPQELAAQAQSIRSGGFWSSQTPRADELNAEYRSLRERVDSLLAQDLSEERLEEELSAIYEQANEKGLVKKQPGIWGGYTDSVRLERRQKENWFNQSFGEFKNEHPLDSSSESERAKELLDRVIDLNSLTPKALERLQSEFPGGNFLFHGATVEQLIKILESGELVNIRVLAERYEERKAKAEEGGEDVEIKAPRRNSGFEGISWSFNRLHALPGDRYHLAGFLASPNRVLGADQQLVVPSRPAPFELLQISGAVDANRFYSLKTQKELLVDLIPTGEGNSVLGNLFAVNMELKRRIETPDEEPFYDEPLLLKFLRENTDEEVIKALRNKYSSRDGKLEFSLDLHQQSREGQIPLAAVWLQALIDSGRIKSVLGFEKAKSIREVVETMTPGSFDDLLNELRKDYNPIREQLEQEEAKIGDININIEDLYFITNKKDLPKWLEVLSRCERAPRGILLYDHNRVRLENWASGHRGDFEALTEQLRQGIKPDPEGWVDYESQVLGEKITPEKLAGYAKHVVGEKYLGKRKTIRNSAGNLAIV